MTTSNDTITDVAPSWEAIEMALTISAAVTTNTLQEVLVEMTQAQSTEERFMVGARVYQLSLLLRHVAGAIKEFLEEAESEKPAMMQEIKMPLVGRRQRTR